MNLFFTQPNGGGANGDGFEHPLPESDEDEDYIDTGAAILNFYCTLVDLLGRCAPESSVIEQGTVEQKFFVTELKFSLFSNKLI